MYCLNCANSWLVKGFDAHHGRPEAWIGKLPDRGFIAATVPGLVHLDLEAASLIKDCRLSCNARDARWVQESVWLYKRTFEWSPDSASGQFDLVCGSLDLNARIYLNGALAGQHHNAFRPARIPVEDHLQAGENVLDIVVEGGFFDELDKSGRNYQYPVNHPWSHHKRHWSRKPQYVYGWDWNPQLVTVGVPGSVELVARRPIRLQSIAVSQSLDKSLVRADCQLRLDFKNDTGAGAEVVVRIELEGYGNVHKQELSVPQSGAERTVAFQVTEPELWWPRGHGQQKLYSLRVTVSHEGEIVADEKRRIGFRRVEIDQAPHEDHTPFIVMVNNRKIFIKGGNWVPADALYSRDRETTEQSLLHEALAANFNFLRIWGGGLYPSDAFMQFCDARGILVWQDFMFACTKYPGTDKDFRREVTAEAEYQVARLSSHASLLLWCGNNELEQAAADGGYDEDPCYPDSQIFHALLPGIVKQWDPHRFYWPSSPWSETPSIHPDDPDHGDQHPWRFPLRDLRTDFHHFRKERSTFANEGGCLGASTWSTLSEMLPESEQCLHSPSWEFHDNESNFMDEGDSTYSLVREWTGIEPTAISLADYALLSGLLQAEALNEFALNFRRRAYRSSAAAFWMFNDSWPTSHGWTILDYYQRRKPAFYRIKRAFQPVGVVPVKEEGWIRIYAFNDSGEDWAGELRYGSFHAKGLTADERRCDMTIPATSVTILAEFAWGNAKRTSGAFAVLEQSGQTVAYERSFFAPFDHLELEPQPKIYRQVCEDGKDWLWSDHFVWSLVLDRNGDKKPEDDIIDLVPGVARSVAGTVESIRCAGNQFFDDSGLRPLQLHEATAISAGEILTKKPKIP